VARQSRISPEDLVVGVDLGGTSLRVALGMTSGQIVAELSESTGELDADRLADRIGGAAARLGAPAFAALGLGIPAPVGAAGIIGSSANVERLSGAPLRSLLQARLGVPVAVENDVNVAALAEHRHGRGHGMNDLAFVAVGTGVGLGVVADGRILRGRSGAAGELGHLPLSVDSPRMPLDQLGPLEAVGSGAGLAARWEHRTGRRESARTIFEAAFRGDAIAGELIDDLVCAVAMGVRAVEALLDPGVVVLGGGIGSRVDVISRVCGYLAAGSEARTRFASSALGARAGIVGAVELARAAAQAGDC
jgi:predicted NBD/HSP70 family sugar kinase